MNINADGDLNESSFEEIAQSLRDFLLSTYKPVFNPTQADFHYTTLEIYSQLQELVPSKYYSIEDVAQWLHQCGFHFADYGNMKLEWMFKRS